MTNGFNIELLLDSLADRVAARLGERLGESNGSAIRPRLLTVSEAARYLGRTRYSVQHLIQNSTLPPVKLDSRTFLDIKDLDRLIDDAKRSV
jgi:hypothetical protein